MSGCAHLDINHVHRYIKDKAMIFGLLRFHTSSLIDIPIRELNRRDTAMHVLSLFNWKLTKNRSQGLCGDYHP